MTMIEEMISSITARFRGGPQMTLLEYIFNGYLIACECGEEFHVPEAQAENIVCPCGRSLSCQRDDLDKAWHLIRSGEIKPEELTIDAA